MLDMHFPVWMIVLGMAMQFWWLFAGVGLALAALGFSQRGRTRRILWIAAGVLCAVPLGFPVLMLGRVVQEWETHAEVRSQHEVLKAPRKLDGALLPVGTDVFWLTKDKMFVENATVPGPSALLGGVMFTGTLKRTETDCSDDSGCWWTGTTVAEHTFPDGWVCRAGEVSVTDSGRLKQCVLAKDKVFWGRVLPAGSDVMNALYVYVTLPKEKGVRLPEIGAVLPGGAELQLVRNGCVHEMFSASSQNVPLRIGRVAFYGYVQLSHQGDGGENESAPCTRATAAQGELAEDYREGGTLFAKGETMRMDLPQ